MKTALMLLPCLCAAHPQPARVPPGDVRYVRDSAWTPALPDGATASAAAVDQYGSVYVAQRTAGSEPIWVLSGVDGSVERTWGSDTIGSAHGVSIQMTDDKELVWVADIANHTLNVYPTDANGAMTAQLGTAGVAGNATDPVQFDHIADVAFHGDNAYAADGDGGTGNRVVALEGTSQQALGALTGFDSPHSVAVHAPSELLVIADRDNNRTALRRLADGSDAGLWACTEKLNLGEGGKPFGVRTFKGRGLDLAFFAVMDNPQDGRHQRLYVIDATELATLDAAAGGSKKGANPAYVGTCPVLQTIPLPGAIISGPHLIGVDPVDGALYVACLNADPLSTVMKFAIESG